MIKSGYSIIEVIVAITLFTIVVAISSGAFLTIINTNRTSTNDNELNNSVEFVLEEFVRNAREGNTYQCGSTNPSTESTTVNLSQPDCSDTGSQNTFIFRNQIGSTTMVYAYWYNQNSRTLYYKNQAITVPLNSTQWQSAFPENIDIAGFSIAVSGSGLTDAIQPRVKIVLTIEDTIRQGGVTTTVRKPYQISITQRILQSS